MLACNGSVFLFRTQTLPSGNSAPWRTWTEKTMPGCWRTCSLWSEREWRMRWSKLHFVNQDFSSLSAFITFLHVLRFVSRLRGFVNAAVRPGEQQRWRAGNCTMTPTWPQVTTDHMLTWLSFLKLGFMMTADRKLEKTAKIRNNLTVCSCRKLRAAACWGKPTARDLEGLLLEDGRGGPHFHLQHPKDSVRN